MDKYTQSYALKCIQIPVCKHIPNRLVPSELDTDDVISNLFTSVQEEKTGDHVSIKSPSKGSVVSWNVTSFK